MIEEAHDTFIRGWDLFSSSSVLGCQFQINQPTPVPYGEVESCSAGQVKIVCKAATHAAISEMSEH